MEIQLENESLRAVLLPDFGGKIISLFCKEGAFEAAAQPRDGAKMASRQGFARHAYGFDDAFPNIAEEDVASSGKKWHYPDHGEIWNADFTVLARGRDFLRMVWESGRFSYRYEKEVRLSGNRLQMRCHIANIGEELPAIWTWHGLMRYEEDMEILLPEGNGKCRNVLLDPVLGEPDTVYPYDNPVYDFRRVPRADSRRAVKYYLEPEESGAAGGAVRLPDGGEGSGMNRQAGGSRVLLPDGGESGAGGMRCGDTGGMVADARGKGKTEAVGGGGSAYRGPLPEVCGFYYPSHGICCMLHYDIRKLPYLGVWVTAGGFGGDHNCALEPSNGFYDGIGKAGENGRLPVLLPGEAVDVELAVSLFPAKRM